MSDTTFVNGTVVQPSWLNDVNDFVYGFPSQTGQGGKFLTTNGSALSWATAGGGGGGTTWAVNVWDYLSTAQKSDVQAGTLLIDCSAAVQTALNAVKAVGGTLLFPRGQYRLDSSLVLNYSAETNDPTQGATNRITLMGEGDGATQFTATHGSALIDHRGGTTGTAGVHSFFIVKGISLYNSTPRQAGSIAIKMDNTSLWHFEDVSILGFEYGVKGTDVLSGCWTSGRLWSCTYGMRFEYVDFSRPNAISIRSVAIAGNRRYGVYVLGPALFTMYGGSVEGNGTDANGLGDSDPIRDTCWGIKADDAGVEGVVGFSVHGGYFEGNSGKADIWISQLANECTHSITGTSFLRFSSTQYTINNLKFDNNPTTIKTRVSIQGCGFRSQSPYTAVNTRPYIGAQVGKIFDQGGCNYFVETELDRAVFAPNPLSRIPTANFPTDVSNYTGGMFWHPDRKRLMVGGDSKFQYAIDGPYEVWSTDSSPTFIYMTNQPTIVWTAGGGTTRNITLSLSNAYIGAVFRIHHKVGSAKQLNIYSAGTGTIICTLHNDGDWAEAQFDGSSWILLRSGVIQAGSPAKSLVRANRSTTLDLGGAVANVTVPFDNEEFDTLSEYSAGSGVFTAKYTGWYKVSATITTNAFAWLAGTQLNIKVMKNGSAYAVGQRDFKSVNSTANSSGSASITTLVQLNAGETIEIAGQTDRVPTADLNLLSASAISNHISIERVA